MISLTYAINASLFAFIISLTLGIFSFLMSVFVTLFICDNLLASLGVTNVIAIPLFPALPVLPILCT